MFLELTKAEELTARWAPWGDGTVGTKRTHQPCLALEGAGLTVEHAEPQAALSKRTETETVTDTDAQDLLQSTWMFLQGTHSRLRRFQSTFRRGERH